MSEVRPLRGGCHCGRNRYIIGIPRDRTQEAQVLFNTDPIHQISLATPLAAYIRVPLPWYQSATYAFFPDEAHGLIRRVYTHPTQQHAKRHFCGYCGTPLSYWSEEPMEESGFISLTLGSLWREDLQDLEDMGLIPESNDGGTQADCEGEEEEGGEKDEASGGQKRVAARKSTALKESHGVPWFDSMVDETRLGNLRRSHGVRQSEDGNVTLQWEIVEYTSGDGEADEDMPDAGATSSGTERSGKRKLEEAEPEEHGR